MPSATTERDTTIHGPSGDPDALIGDVPEGPILMPDAIVQADVVLPIRLNHLNNDRHDIRHPSGEWFSFRDHVFLVDTGDAERNEEIATWIEDLIGRDIIKRDDLPQPIECLLCKAKGQYFVTKCLPLYSKHMLIAHQ